MTLPAASATPMKSGLKRSALLMRALGARASAVWSQLSPQEAETLSRAMQALPEDAASEHRAVESYVASMAQTKSAPRAEPRSIWARLSNCERTVIAGLIQEESPQVIALTLSRLDPDAAANAVRALPRALATEALKRMLSLGEVHPAAMKGLELALAARLDQALPGHAQSGHEQVARIFDRLDSKSEESLLSSLDTAEPGAGEKIRAFMFTFEDLANLDAASLQTILGNVDRSVLTLALKGAPEPVATAFFSNITQRAADLLRDEIEATGPMRRSEIDAARSDIIEIARTLVKRGDILTGHAEDELIE
nr:FliG C-terminal domain-containing protein [Hyphomonas sp. Mor2]